jgi:hypothetical protein
MDYINGKTKAIATHRAVCAEVGASIPQGQAHGDWFPILPSDPPVPTEGQVVTASEPVKKSGSWYMGWAVRDKTPEDLSADRELMAARIAERRWTAEVEGITVSGMRVETDDRAKLLINGAAVEAMIDPDYVMSWRTADGFVELTGAQVIAIARAVRSHVQACFDREAELIALVESGKMTDHALDEGWPS